MFEPVCTTREDAWRSFWELLFTLIAFAMAGAVGYLMYVVTYTIIGV